MAGRKSKLLTATLFFGLAAMSGQAVNAFENTATSGRSVTVGPGGSFGAPTQVGYEVNRASDAAEPGQTTVENVAWSNDEWVGYADSAGRGPTSVQVKQALGVYQKNREGLGSRELTLEPMEDGVLVGIKLAW